MRTSVRALGRAVRDRHGHELRVGDYVTISGPIRRHAGHGVVVAFERRNVVVVDSQGREHVANPFTLSLW